MREQHEVYLGKQKVGKVQVLRQGLYYRFICRCKLNSQLMWRLYVTCGGDKLNLGVVVPMEDGFGLETRIPAKRIGEGEMEFVLLPKHETYSSFIPIYPQEPFAYIEQIKNGYLSIKDGQMGLLLTK